MLNGIRIENVILGFLIGSENAKEFVSLGVHEMKKFNHDINPDGYKENSKYLNMLNAYTYLNIIYNRVIKMYPAVKKDVSWATRVNIKIKILFGIKLYEFKFKTNNKIIEDDVNNITYSYSYNNGYCE